MLKHTEILNKMSAKQKIALAANIHCLADNEYTELGIPRVKFTTLDELFAKDGNGLTPYILARSWDLDLIFKVTKEIIEHNCSDENVILVPSPKINLGAEAERALSEDPLLSTQISLAFLSAVEKCSKIGVVSDFYLTKKEVANMDIVPDAKALNDFIYAPFSKVVTSGKAKAVIGSISQNIGAYEDFNRSLIRSKNNYLPKETDVLCLCRTYDETIAALDENCIIYTGVELAIQNAYNQYQTILSDITKGRASMLNLEDEFEHKSAISDQMLDNSIDKVIDFAFRITGTDIKSDTEQEVAEEIQNVPARLSDEEYDELLTLANEKSTVLLKNTNNTLPINKEEKFAIIGDAALEEDENGISFAKHFIEFSPDRCVGTERGYAMLEDRSDDLIASATTLAKQASTVFVFLKPRHQKNAAYPCTSLPANQTALINALSSCNCKIVAIMCTETNVDVSFGKYTNGLLLAPIAGRLSAEALANVIFGRTPASGKLTTSFYTSPNKFYNKQRFYKDNERNKVSIFTGYRFYESQGISVSYPFGHGLKYSGLEITNARWSTGNLIFTIRNTGSVDIDETIEIYSELPSSKLLRPKKELKAFLTLRVKAGRAETVTAKNINLEAYNPAQRCNILESGEYMLHIGTSVKDIKATISAHVYGKQVNSAPPKMSDYLQSKTNIITNNYTLEAKHEKMTNYKSLRNAGLLCLLVSILIALMSISVESPLVPLIIGSIALLVSVALLVSSSNIQRRIKAEEAELVEKNKELFKNADSATTEKLEDLFLKEFKFDVTDTAVIVDDTDEVYVDAGTTMLNENMSFNVAATDLQKIAADMGITIDDNSAFNIIASVISSKLIIAKNALRCNLDSYLNAISYYFGAKLYTEHITEAHALADRLLRVTAEDETKTATSVLNALISANENPQVMHIIHLKNLRADNLAEYLTPYIKYFSNPRASAEVSAKGSDEIYNIPSNVWFFTELEHEALVENIPSYLLEYATVLPVKYTECQPSEVKSLYVPITLTDFEFLTEKSRSKFVLSEDVWKKMDEIESFVFKYSSYKIGNKLWLRIETYISALLSMNTELPLAIDSAMASVLLPTLASALVGKLDGADKTLIDELERVFGEDNIPTSHEMLVSKA